MEGKTRGDEGFALLEEQSENLAQLGAVDEADGVFVQAVDQGHETVLAADMVTHLVAPFEVVRGSAFPRLPLPHQ